MTLMTDCIYPYQMTMKSSWFSAFSSATTSCNAWLYSSPRASIFFLDASPKGPGAQAHWHSIGKVGKMGGNLNGVQGGCCRDKL
jgi:hypothetical protein